MAERQGDIGGDWIATKGLPSRMEVVQSHKRLIEDTWVEPSLVDRRRLTLQAEQRIDGGLCRTDRVFDGEHHVLRQLAKLAHRPRFLDPFGTTCVRSPFARRRN